MQIHKSIQSVLVVKMIPIIFSKQTQPILYQWQILSLRGQERLMTF